MSELLEVRHLYKSFSLGDITVPVLKDINMSISAGQLCAIVGASGAGKSTLLHILGTLDRPTKGDVLLEGTSIFSHDDVQLSKIRNQKLGFVFQFHHLLNEFTALENVMMPALISGMNRKKAKALAFDWLKKVGLVERSGHKPTELSGGEQQRVAIARALILSPPMLLADELTGNLDSASGKAIIELLLELNQSLRMTMIIVTHNEAVAEQIPLQYQIHDGELKRLYKE